MAKQKTYSIHVRITKADRKRFERAAALDRRPLATWLRNAALDAIERQVSGMVASGAMPVR